MIIVVIVGLFVYILFSVVTIVLIKSDDTREKDTINDKNKDEC